ncbi:hypothetical protein GCM10010282_71220 [Streptomyces roseolus]|nr:hypothetical protein GCM10010282_71220 [Streptomyces roseolus]
MKADRLVATLLLLQERGQVTAREVARELEISERTARRDLEALASSGVPVYSQRGRGGGWQLVGGARTDLTGLTTGETEALFAAATRAPSSPELRSALRKLTRALPAPMRPVAEAAARSAAAEPRDPARTHEPPGARESLTRPGNPIVAAYGGDRGVSHFPLGTYYSEDASVRNVTARSTVRPVRRGLPAAANSPQPH